MIATLAFTLLAALLLPTAQQLQAGRGRMPKLATEPEWTILKPSNTGIPGDTVLDLFIDGNDRPWIPGYVPFWEEGGMARWDEADDTWFVLSNVDHPQIASPRFNDIDSDANGVIWIGTEAGLLRYDPSKPPGAMTRYDEFNTPMPGAQIDQVDIAPDGSVWLAIHNNGAVPPGGLVRFDPVADTWQVVYFGSMEMGAATWKGGVFTWLKDPPASGPHVWGLPSDDATDKQRGSIWLSTDQGLVRRDSDGSMTVVGSPVSGSVEALGNGRVGLRSAGGNVWLYDGSWTNKGNWGGGTTYALAETSSGDLWVGGSGGAARLKAGTSEWQRYRLTNTGMLGYFMDTIDFDDAGNVYMNGTDYWPLNPQWITFGLDEDSLGRLWSGNSGKLFVYDQGGMVQFDTSNSPVFPLPVKDIVADATLPGFVYAVTGEGVVHTDGVTWFVYPRAVLGLTQFSIGHFLTAVAPAADGTLWIGTGLGIFHLDPATLLYEKYTKETTSWSRRTARSG